MRLSHYIGQIVELIYLDRKDKLTQRRVKILFIESDTLHAYCFKRKCARTFSSENILAVRPVKNAV